MDRIQLQSFSQPALTRPIQALTQANQITSQYGLMLTEQQMLSLLQQRQEALEATGRVEFGDGVLHLLAEPRKIVLQQILVGILAGHHLAAVHAQAAHQFVA